MTVAVKDKTPIIVPRCDRCGAESKTVAISPDGEHKLFFCQHHTNENEAKLQELGWLIAERTS